MTVMRQGEAYAYEIVRHNHTSDGYTTVGVVKGESAAERAVHYYNQRLTAEEKGAGWSNFAQRTTKKPWPKENPRVVNLKPDTFRKR